MKKILWITTLAMVWGVFVISTNLFGEETAAGETALRVEDAVICRDVVDRVPVGVGEVFPYDLSKLYCFTRVVGANKPTQITHNWYYDGKMAASVTLTVRTSSYRTYSSKRIPPNQAGEWMVEILSETGVPLTRLVFSVH